MEFNLQARNRIFTCFTTCTMLYRSAQTAPGGKTYTFEEAIMAGWAEDGGMLMPVDTPRVSRDTLRAWATLSYPQLVMAFLKMYVGADEVGDADLEGIISGAFAQFGDTEVVKMRGLDAAATMPWLDAASGPVHVLELWHGPTLAFKDLGMQVLVHFLKFFLARRQERITLLVGTSGDTGRYGGGEGRECWEARAGAVCLSVRCCVCAACATCAVCVRCGRCVCVCVCMRMNGCSE